MKGFPLIRIVDDDQELLNSQKMLLETLGWEVAVYESALDFWPETTSIGRDA